MITRLLFVSILCLSVVPAGADDPAQANRLLVEAVKLIQAAEQEQPAPEKLVILESALAKLNQIMDDHPSSDVAVKLITDQEIGILSLPKLMDTIQAAEGRTAHELAVEILDADPSREGIMARLDELADLEYQHKVLDRISLMLRLTNRVEDRLFFANLFEDAPTRDDHLQSIALDLVYEGSYRQALAVVELIKADRNRDVVRKEIVSTDLSAGNLERALTTARGIESQSIRDVALQTIVAIQLKEDDFQGALAAAELMEKGERKALTLRAIEEEAYRHDGRLPQRQ